MLKLNDAMASTLDAEDLPPELIPEVRREANLKRELSVDSLSLDDMSMDKEEDQPSSCKITKKETQDVLQLKLLVLLILVVSAATIASGAFVYITRGEKSQFETKFNNDAVKVLESVGSSLHRTLGLLDSLAVTYVSYAQSQNDTWPFVALPNFGARMAKVLPLTDAFAINMAPIVHPETRREWEEFSLQNDEWVNQSIALQETWDGFYGPIHYDWKPYGVIFGDKGDIAANVRYVISDQSA
jgi:hypothetical protein